MTFTRFYSVARPVLILALLLVLTLVVAVVGWNLNALILRARSTLDGAEPNVVGFTAALQKASAPLPALIEKNAPRVNQIMLAAELATLDAQRALKVQRQEWESPEYIRWRQHGFRAGEQATIAIAHLTNETLPRADALISRLDANLNDKLLPEATATLAALRRTAETFNTDGHAVLAEVLTLTKQGQASLDAINRTLASPLWLQTLANIERGTAGLAVASEQLAEAFKHLPQTAAHIEGIFKALQSASRFQKPVLIAQLLATIAGIFVP